jgi:hypothetical protein
MTLIPDGKTNHEIVVDFFANILNRAQLTD